MKNFIAILREPDGRANQPPAEVKIKHQLDWKSYFEKWAREGKLVVGSDLSLTRKIIYHGGCFENKIHKSGTEIVGGFLLINAADLDEAVEIIKQCSIYDCDGYAEIREFRNHQ